MCGGSKNFVVLSGCVAFRNNELPDRRSPLSPVSRDLAVGIRYSALKDRGLTSRSILGEHQRPI
jgi:hypothetical protein